MIDSKTKKEGIARLMELVETNKFRLFLACALSVLSSLFKIVPFFTIYLILKNMISIYYSGTHFSFGSVNHLVYITAASALLYGICAYSSAMIAHGAAGSDISFKDVYFAYDGENDIIKGISFDIPERNFVALVGSSGSGKTTIARLLARFWDIRQGEISIGGIGCSSNARDRESQAAHQPCEDTLWYMGCVVCVGLYHACNSRYSGEIVYEHRDKECKFHI